MDQETSMDQETWKEQVVAYEYAAEPAGYWLVMPPSITSSAPVTKEDSSEAR